MLSTRFTGRMRPGYRYFCGTLSAILKRPKTLCKKRSFRYGLGRTGFSQIAGRPFVPISTGSRRSVLRNGGESKAHRVRGQRTKRAFARQKPFRSWVTHSGGSQRNNEHCCGYAQWKGNHTRNSRRLLKYLSER